MKQMYILQSPVNNLYYTEYRPEKMKCYHFAVYPSGAIKYPNKGEADRVNNETFKGNMNVITLETK